MYVVWAFVQYARIGDINLCFGSNQIENKSSVTQGKKICYSLSLTLAIYADR